MNVSRFLLSLGGGIWLATACFAADPPALALPAAPKTAVELEKAVELPPMIISETSKAPPWLYVAIGDSEYLSRCSNATTRAFVTAQLEIQQMLRVFVPPDLLAPAVIPTVSILAPLEANRGTEDAVSREMMRQAKQAAPERKQEPRGGRQGAGQVRGQAPGRGQAAGQGRGQAQGRGQGPERPEAAGLRFLPNLRLDDRDMMAVFSYINERDFRRENLIAAPEYVRSRLIRRTPTLPEWLIEGISRLYVQANFRVAPITMQPTSWLSPEDTEGLQRDPESRRVMIPVSELFATDALSSAENQNPTRVSAWQAQAALFVRWALDPANSPAAESLWRFARRVSQEPASDSVFRECFGFGYADLQDRLSDYLPTAVRQPARIVPGKLPPLPRFEVKPATPAQIARLRGEWERLEIPFVRTRHAEFLAKYIEQARTTLRRAVGRGERDPRLFAALGLCELDAGDAAAARPYLEQAAAAKVARPRVYYEIARLRWVDLNRDKPENTGYTVAELEPVLEPLRVAAAQSPALPEVYLLMAEAWLRCGERVRASDLPALVAATPLFRRIPAVSYRVALLQIREGQRTEAARLLALGAEFAVEPSVRAQYQQVLAAITAPARPAGEKE